MVRELNLAVMPGDYIGKDVVAEEMRVHHAAAEKYGFTIKTTDYPHGGEHYRKTGEVLPDSVVGELRQHDAIVFGAVGDPDVDKSILEKGILLKTRFDMDLYINLRPSKLYPGVEAEIRKSHPELPDGYELIVVREGVGGLYTGMGGVRKDGSGRVVAATQIMHYTREDAERTTRYAFELARKKGHAAGTKPWPVTLGFKSNVLEHVSKALWEPVFWEVAKEYSSVPANYAHIDALIGPWILNNPLPEDGWIIVTGNTFGDLITDETASLFGGMGGGASGCIHPGKTSMFEPLHGSSPKDHKKDVVSPIAAILSGALMYRELGMGEAARGIEQAVWAVLSSGKIPNLTISSGVPTQKQTELVLEELMKGGA